MDKRHIALAEMRLPPNARKYVDDALAKNRLSYGPYSKRFEKEFAAVTGRDYAFLCNSGTSGLQVALHALKELYGWADGDEVIVPAMTFISSSNVIIQNNLRPVFVDVEPDHYCIDPSKIEAAITPKTRAIMPVHLFGQSSDMKRIMEIAKKHDLKVIEDSCEAVLVDYEGKPVGSMGDVSVFSTYIAHIVVTGVGGVITTSDKKLATMIKSLLFHGRDNIYLDIDDDNTTDIKKLEDLIHGRYKFIHMGYSYRLTEMESAVGVANLEQADWIRQKRKEAGRKMTKALSGFDPFLQLPQERERGQHIYMLYPIVIKDKRINRDELLLHLEVNGIETRLFFPLLSQPVYVKLFGDIEKNYPVAHNLVENGFIIGCHAYLTDEDFEYIRNVFNDFISKLT